MRQVKLESEYAFFILCAYTEWALYKTGELDCGFEN